MYEAIVSRYQLISSVREWSPRKLKLIIGRVPWSLWLLIQGQFPEHSTGKWIPNGIWQYSWADEAEIKFGVIEADENCRVEYQRGMNCTERVPINLLRGVSMCVFGKSFVFTCIEWDSMRLSYSKFESWMKILEVAQSWGALKNWTSQSGETSLISWAFSWGSRKNTT